MPTWPMPCNIRCTSHIDNIEKDRHIMDRINDDRCEAAQAISAEQIV